MFFTYLTGVARRVRPLTTPLLVVAVSALLALLFTFATQPPAEPPRAAGEAKIQLLKDEHALVADLVRGIQDGAKAERRAAERSWAEMRTLALAETRKQPVQAAVAQAGKTPVRVALPASKPSPAIESPLPLQAATMSEPRPRRPVVARARAALAAVQEIPHWLRSGVENVADWATTIPSKAISQLPERRFL